MIIRRQFIPRAKARGLLAYGVIKYHTLYRIMIPFFCICISPYVFWISKIDWIFLSYAQLTISIQCHCGISMLLQTLKMGK